MRRHSEEWWKTLPSEKVGKETEKLVEKLFTGWNSRADFSWHRLPDARAARGFLAAQPADYLWWRKPYGGYLEVKATQHGYRLPKDKVRQINLLHKHALAGAQCFVLVHHYLSGQWRAVDVNNLDQGVSSWDLSPHSTYNTPAEALIGTGYF